MLPFLTRNNHPLTKRPMVPLPDKEVPVSSMFDKLVPIYINLSNKPTNRGKTAFLSSRLHCVYQSHRSLQHNILLVINLGYFFQAKLFLSFRNCRLLNNKCKYLLTTGQFYESYRYFEPYREDVKAMLTCNSTILAEIDRLKSQLFQ